MPNSSFSKPHPARRRLRRATQGDADEALIQQDLDINAGHPWDLEPGYDHLYINATSQDALPPLIEQYQQRGWDIWIHGTRGDFFAAVLFRKAKAMNVFCFGSPTITQLPVRLAMTLATIINQEGRFLLTDGAGFSSRIQLFIADERYPEVALYHVGDRPLINHGNFTTVPVPAELGADFFAATKQAASSSANFGLALYDETNHVAFRRPAKHDDTLNLTRSLLEAGKPVKFFFAHIKAILHLKTMDNFALIEATLQEHY